MGTRCVVMFCVTATDVHGCAFSSRLSDPEVRCPGQVLVNASLSDVVATTSAEALAMGKWILVAQHPENAFFEQLKNCLIYDSSDDFVRCVVRNLPHWQCITEPVVICGHEAKLLVCRLWKHAIENEPPPLVQADYEWVLRPKLFGLPCDWPAMLCLCRSACNMVMFLAGGSPGNRPRSDCCRPPQSRPRSGPRPRRRWLT
jgi:hypothetical protein